MSNFGLNSVQFLLILFVVGTDAELPQVSTHSCPKAAFLYKLNGYSYNGIAPSVPKKTYFPEFDRNAYAYRLDLGFAVGQTLHVRVTMPRDTPVFSIVLLSNTPVVHTNDQFALHMQIRVGKVYYYSHVAGRWDEHKEKAPPAIQYDIPCDVRIHALSDRFEISFDGKKHTEFKYRMPLDLINHVSVESNVTLNEIHIGGPMPDNVQRVDMPNGPWKDGERIRVTGITTNELFEINVLDANGLCAFHFNPRFTQGHVVRNTQLSRFKWGKEELIGAQPFRKNVEFLVEFVKNAWGIEIYVNHVYSYTYKHRISNPTVGYTAVGFVGFAVHEFEVCTTY